ncbi:hypothetical protein [uncultured Draconibacterium sp.]|uniref:hypothetical protein n=1 Tax=uncultured Draconibacterium sp. TaxID=1573823 RepID=UPI0032168B02
MANKLKCYVITVSKNFPVSHPKKGTPTGFKAKIGDKTKKHTIRGNYELWQKRFEQINQDKAYLSVREWSGKPYASKQVELYKLYASDNIGLEKLSNPKNFVWAEIEGKQNWEDVAKNDGLSFDDFCEWFKVRQDKPMAVIHFTGFRYGVGGN